MTSQFHCRRTRYQMFKALTPNKAYSKVWMCCGTCGKVGAGLPCYFKAWFKLGVVDKVKSPLVVACDKYMLVVLRES